MTSSPRGAVSLFWMALLALAWAIYSLGLPGSFIFDDAPNLNRLQAIAPGSVDDLLAFSLQGIAGPSGRPLSLLSFALQHASWPAAPEDFKRVNIFIHLLNATLLLWLLIQVQRLRGLTSNPKALGVPLLAAAIWLLWPIQVSSVLYVVQRMTLLSASCMLIGLCLYVHARIRLDQAQGAWGALLLMLVSLFVGMILGILCKENAIIFPLLVLATEATLFSHKPRLPVLWRMALWLPLLAFAAYLLFVNQPWLRYGNRDFSLVERLLTEPRILWMYVMHIAAPSAGALRFLYDNYELSRGLLSPLTTVLALVGWIVTGMAAWFLRRRHPVAAFAALFFLASHALESTFMPLELVFEHRNYVGSLALAFAIASGIIWGTNATRGQRRGAVLAATALYLVLISAVTANVAQLWGNPLVQKRFWFKQNPSSARVHHQYAAELLHAGHAIEAAAIMDAAVQRFPEHLSFHLARAELACFHPELGSDSLREATQSPAVAKEDVLPTVAFLDRMVVAYTADKCPAYEAEELIAAIRALRGHPAIKRRLVDLHVLEGIICSHVGNQMCAKKALDAAIRTNPTPRLLVQAASWEIGNRNFHDARLHIDALKRLELTRPVSYYALVDDIRMLVEQLKQAESDAPE